MFLIIFILHIWLSITCLLFSLLEPSFINSVIIGITGFIISYIFFRQYKHYKGLNLEITFDKSFQKIKIQKELPKKEYLGHIRFSDIEAIVINKNYLDPEKCNLSFFFKNEKEFEFFEGERDECLRFGNLFSEIMEKPVYFKEKLNWVLISCNLGFIFLLLTSILLNDIIGQILFFTGLIFSNFFNITSILGADQKIK